MWGPLASSPSRHLVNGHDGSPVLSSATASVYHRLSPYDGLYPSPFHTSPSALSLRGLSPGLLTLNYKLLQTYFEL